MSYSNFGLKQNRYNCTGAKERDVVMKKNRTKYEKKIMLNLNIITFMCVVSSILNIALPIFDNPQFTFFIISQFFAIGGIYVYGWINSRRNQGIPLSVAFIVRGLQALIFVFWRNDVTWTSFGVLVFMDVLLIVLLVLDKANYKYTVIKYEDDEFFDK